MLGAVVHQKTWESATVSELIGIWNFDCRASVIGRLPPLPSNHQVRGLFIIQQVLILLSKLTILSTYDVPSTAFAAIESGHKLRQADEQPFDLCFGGRRQFCKRSYSDLGEWREALSLWYTPSPPWKSPQPFARGGGSPSPNPPLALFWGKLQPSE